MANTGDGQFGDTIRALRKRRGEPLRVVAAAIDVDSTLLSKIERGNRLPTNDQVAKLAVYFGVPADDLAAQAIAEKIVLDYGNERATLQAVNIVRERLAQYGGE